MRRSGLTAVIALASLAVATPAASASPPGTTFSYTGAEQMYMVPAGVTGISVEAVGAAGGPGRGPSGGGGASGGTGAPGATAAGQLAVTPGQVLYVEVGGRGATGDSNGAGGFNGGGSGNTGSGGGGGASDVRTCPIGTVSCAGAADSPSSRLLVAAGGGGGGTPYGQSAGGNGGGSGVVNGDPGDPGNGSGTPGGGGGGATLAAGGAGGVAGSPCALAQQPGAPGGFGTGGAGGGTFWGGGGGGGYWGGGGGGSACESAGVGMPAPGGGGGGGSSYGPPGTISGPDRSRIPSVTIVPLPAPALATSPGSLLFAAQPRGMASPPQSVTVSNSGPGALNVTGLQLGGSAPADFYVSSSTCGGAIPAGSSCQVTVRFAPMAQGPRSAALVIASDDPASPASVSLSGSGTPPPQGPAGNPGARGPQGANGKVELVRCKTVTKTITKTINHKRQLVKVTQLQCTARLVTGPIKFTTAGAAVKASISRGSVLFATGVSVPTGGGHSQVVLRELRRLRAGRYTLTLRHRSRILRREITIT